jgi:hypothetical protein
MKLSTGVDARNVRNICQQWRKSFRTADMGAERAHIQYSAMLPGLQIDALARGRRRLTIGMPKQ